MEHFGEQCLRAEKMNSCQLNKRRAIVFRFEGHALPEGALCHLSVLLTPHKDKALNMKNMIYGNSI